MEHLLSSYASDDNNDDNSQDHHDGKDKKQEIEAGKKAKQQKLKEKFILLQSLHSQHADGDMTSYLQAMDRLISFQQQEGCTYSLVKWQFYLQKCGEALRAQRGLSSHPERLIGKRTSSADSVMNDGMTETAAKKRKEEEVFSVVEWWIRQRSNHICATSTLLNSHSSKEDNNHDAILSLWYEYVLVNHDVLKCISQKDKVSFDAKLVMAFAMDLIHFMQHEFQSISHLANLPTSRRIIDFILHAIKFVFEHSAEKMTDRIESVETAVNFWKAGVDVCLHVLIHHVEVVKRSKSMNQRCNLYFIDGGKVDPEELQVLMYSSLVYLMFLPLHYITDLVLISAVLGKLEDILRFMFDHGSHSIDVILHNLSRSDVVLFSFVSQLLEVDLQLQKLQRSNTTLSISEEQRLQINHLLASLRFGYDSKNQDYWLDSVSVFISLCSETVFGYDATSVMDMLCGPDTAVQAISYFLRFFKSMTLSSLKSTASLKTSGKIALNKMKAVNLPSSGLENNNVIIWVEQFLNEEDLNQTAKFRKETIDPMEWCNKTDQIELDMHDDQSESDMFTEENLEDLLGMWEDIYDKLQESSSKKTLPFDPKMLYLRIGNFFGEFV